MALENGVKSHRLVNVRIRISILYFGHTVFDDLPVVEQLFDWVGTC